MGSHCDTFQMAPAGAPNPCLVHNRPEHELMSATMGRNADHLHVSTTRLTSHLHVSTTLLTSHAIHVFAVRVHTIRMSHHCFPHKHRPRPSGPDSRRSASMHAETLDGVHVTAVAPDGSSPSRDWFKGNTLFYFSWWIAWSPFVGMFIAKISRGRTVRQVINGALMGPALYCFIWFAIFGGTGLRIERQAANLGITCGTDATGAAVFEQALSNNSTVALANPMIAIAGREFWRLSCRSQTSMWFDLFANFPMTKYGPPRHTACMPPLHARSHTFSSAFNVS